MSQDLSDSQFKALWRQGQIPVIFKPSRPRPVLARISDLLTGTWSGSEMIDARSLRAMSSSRPGKSDPWFDSVIKLELKR